MDKAMVALPTFADTLGHEQEGPLRKAAHTVEQRGSKDGSLPKPGLGDQAMRQLKLGRLLR